MYFISIEFPLRKKAIYHSLLPIGRAYDITKTMRDFLLEKELMEIFTSFLEYRD